MCGPAGTSRTERDGGRSAGRRADRARDGRRRHELNRHIHAGALLAHGQFDRRCRADVGCAGMKDRCVVQSYRGHRQRRLARLDRSGRSAGARRLHRLPHLARGQLPDVVVATPRDGWHDDHEIPARGQAVGAVLAAIVGEARAAGAWRAERTLAGHRVIANLEHAHVQSRHRPPADVADDAGDHAAARDRHREILHGLAVLHDHRRARPVRPRRAVAGSQVRVLERLQLVLAGGQVVKRERAAVVGGRRLSRRRPRDACERHAHAPRRLFRLAGDKDPAGDRPGASCDACVVTHWWLRRRGRAADDPEDEDNLRSANHRIAFTRRSSVFGASPSATVSFVACPASASRVAGSLQPSMSDSASAIA